MALAPMVGIPSVLETDAEDVAWALQTAEALWKRNERVDAIVWLRRAAQAAGEAEDDDRALTLARGAAELAEWLAQNPPPAAPHSVPPRPVSNAPTAAEAVDDLLRTSQADEIRGTPFGAAGGVGSARVGSWRFRSAEPAPASGSRWYPSASSGAVLATAASSSASATTSAASGTRAPAHADGR